MSGNRDKDIDEIKEVLFGDKGIKERLIRTEMNQTQAVKTTENLVKIVQVLSDNSIRQEETNKQTSVFLADLGSSVKKLIVFQTSTTASKVTKGQMLVMILGFGTLLVAVAGLFIKIS